MPALDWTDGVANAAREGRLLAYLEERVPRDLWLTAFDHDEGWKLLHYGAAYGDDRAVAALLGMGASPHERTTAGNTPAHWAAWKGHASTLKLLLAAGADMAALNTEDSTPLEDALTVSQVECVRVMVCNGARLEDAHLHRTPHFMEAMFALQTGVRGCRAVVIAMLGIKRRRVAALQRHDRFVIVLVVLEIWTSRGDVGWQRRK